MSGPSCDLLGATAQFENFVSYAARKASASLNCCDAVTPTDKNHTQGRCSSACGSLNFGLRRKMLCSTTAGDIDLGNCNAVCGCSVFLLQSCLQRNQHSGPHHHTLRRSRRVRRGRLIGALLLPLTPLIVPPCFCDCRRQEKTRALSGHQNEFFHSDDRLRHVPLHAPRCPRIVLPNFHLTCTREQIRKSKHIPLMLACQRDQLGSLVRIPWVQTTPIPALNSERGQIERRSVLQQPTATLAVGMSNSISSTTRRLRVQSNDRWPRTPRGGPARRRLAARQGSVLSSRGREPEVERRRGAAVVPSVRWSFSHA